MRRNRTSRTERPKGRQGRRTRRSTFVATERLLLFCDQCRRGFSQLLSRWMQRLAPHISLGRRGEREAARFLKRLGYRVLERGVRTRLGEIDLIVLDGRTVVFVEVKTRESSATGHPVDAVDAAKQRRLTRLATAYLKRRRLTGYAARFDIVAVTWNPAVRRPRIEHFPNAFDAAD